MKLTHGSLLFAALLALAPFAVAEAKTSPKQPTAPAAANVEQPQTQAEAPPPSVTTPPVAAQPAGKNASQEKATKSLKVGELEISRIEFAQGGDKMDVFAVIHNNGKADETLSGAENRLEGGMVTLIHKGKDGGYYEGPVSVIIPAGKSVDLSASEQWIRITGVKGTKAHTELPVSFYFRRSPNADMILTAQSLSSTTKSLDAKVKDISAEKQETPPITATAPGEAAGATPAAPTPAAAPQKPSSGKGGVQGLLDWFKK